MEQTQAMLRRVIGEIRADMACAVSDWVVFEPKLDACLAAVDSEPVDSGATNDLFELLASRPEALRILLRALALARADAISLQKGVPPGFIASDTTWVTVPIYYATDRARTNSTVPNKFYGAERGELEFGRAEVSVPFQHRRGALERPNWWKFQFRETPEKHVVLLTISPLALDSYVSDIRADLAQTGETSALVFVHGYYASVIA